jgi:FtsP/CotA-like multicopper oxidase with cupredoxin domain
MTRNARIGFLIAAVAVLAVAFVVIGTGDDDGLDPATTANTPTQTAAPTTGGTEAQPQNTPETTPTADPVIMIEVKGGEPVGGVQEIEVDKGDRVQYTVTSDAPEEVHTHGYDIAMDVAPGKPAKFDFTADIDGIYEVELEDSAVQIAKLRVNP